MMIQVHFANNTYDYVNEQTLQRLLIKQSDLIRFKRSSGWVVVGFDELRKTTRNDDHKHLVKAKKIIRVLYNDNRYDYVTDEMLDDLIESDRVAKFERSTGWATVGVDQVRKVNAAKKLHRLQNKQGFSAKAGNPCLFPANTEATSESEY